MTEKTSLIPAQLGLRAGDWVVVRSKEEILSTLDERACLDRMPFQPEMFAFCGKRMRVSKVAHKTCDSVNKTGGRSVADAVYLEGSRCDGASHGGCQADCLFFWKESWLRRENDPPAEPVSPKRCAEATVWRRVKAPGEETIPDPTWVCQTTRIFEATEHLNWWDVRQYVRDVTSGNHKAGYMAKLLLFAGYRKLVRIGIGYRFLVGFFNWFQSLRGGRSYPVADGKIPDGKPTPTETLNLQPGEWVQVRTSAEIRETITRRGFNRGMRFDLELERYCGGQYRVQMRVDQLINEQTGKLMTMKNPCIQLEDVYCRGECTEMRLGCPRAMNAYFREIWLKRVKTPAQANSPATLQPGSSEQVTSGSHRGSER